MKSEISISEANTWNKRNKITLDFDVIITIMLDLRSVGNLLKQSLDSVISRGPFQTYSSEILCDFNIVFVYTLEIYSDDIFLYLR